MNNLKLRMLHQHVHPRNVPDLLNTLAKIGVKSKMLDRFKKDHLAYVEELRRGLTNVTHFTEKRIKDAPMVIAIRMLREDTGVGLREALWFYKYLNKGIIPWFLE